MKEHRSRVQMVDRLECVLSVVVCLHATPTWVRTPPSPILRVGTQTGRHTALAQTHKSHSTLGGDKCGAQCQQWTPVTEGQIPPDTFKTPLQRQVGQQALLHTSRQPLLTRLAHWLGLAALAHLGLGAVCRCCLGVHSQHAERVPAVAVPPGPGAAAAAAASRCCLPAAVQACLELHHCLSDAQVLHIHDVCCV